MKCLRGNVSHTIIPDLVNPSDSSVVDSPLQKAELLNSFFTRQTVLPGEENMDPDTQSLPTNDNSLTSFSTTPCEVFDVLSALNVRKAHGLDDIPPGLLRFRAKGIACSLATLFNCGHSSIQERMSC